MKSPRPPRSAWLEGGPRSPFSKKGGGQDSSPFLRGDRGSSIHFDASNLYTTILEVDKQGLFCEIIDKEAEICSGGQNPCHVRILTKQTKKQ
jgi:hypothetical protein